VIPPTPSAVAADAKLRRPIELNLAVLWILAALLWALRHQYAGITSDAQLYAFQALARLHPALATDLTLQNTSQDDYTLFTPLYAALIGLIDVRPAALALWIPCCLGTSIAAWFVVRRFAAREVAVLSVAVLAITVGSYGAATVFRYDEDYFTARSAAEALIVIALACHLRGRRMSGFGIAIGALAIHPLMALPGVLLLLCLSIPSRLAVAGAFAGLLATLVLAGTRLLTVMDPAWLEIVRERSQFLFLPLWSLRDWELNARPFLALGLSYAVLDDALVRKLSLGAMLVGGAGLGVALIAGAVGPVAILLQGQAWRWVWITTLIAVLLIVPTTSRLWREKDCGALCSVLWISAWCFGGAGGLACLVGLAAIWTWRNRLAAVMGSRLRWAAAAGAGGMLLWTIAQSWTIAIGSNPEKLRAVFALGIPGAVLILLVWMALTRCRPRWIAAMLAATLFACLVAVLPSSFPQRSRIGSPGQVREFEDWRSVIPPTGTVFVPGSKDSGGFVWLTLGRPSYLSIDQSAGVVFSRATSLEVRRRSEVLRPVQDPDWKIMSRLANARAGRGPKTDESRPLTAASLAQICRDPVLGFVAAPQNVGFEPVRHTIPGAWTGWNLYDCNRVRAAVSKP